MKRPLQIILGILVVISGILSAWARHKAQAEAELWAEATDQF